MSHRNLHLPAHLVQQRRGSIVATGPLSTATFNSNSAAPGMIDSSVLLRVLKDPIHCYNFHAFLEKTYSQENLDMWTEVEKFKHSSFASEKMLFSEANRIYITFFDESSPTEVNIVVSSHLAIRYLSCFLLLQRDLFILLNFIVFSFASHFLVCSVRTLFLYIYFLG